MKSTLNMLGALALFFFGAITAVVSFWIIDNIKHLYLAIPEDADQLFHRITDLDFGWTAWAVIMLVAGVALAMVGLFFLFRSVDREEV